MFQINRKTEKIAYISSRVCQRQLFPLFLYRPQRRRKSGSRLRCSSRSCGISPTASGELTKNMSESTPNANSGSLYHNFKGGFRVVLMALVDANLEFIYVDAGQCGRHAEGGIWRNCAFNQRMEQGVAHIPPPRELPGTDVQSPYVILVDGAFPLTEHLQQPYCRRNMTEYLRLLRMDEDCFDFLLEALRPDITYQDTNRRRAVTPEQRLSTFLHFVATGKLKKITNRNHISVG